VIVLVVERRFEEAARLLEEELKRSEPRLQDAATTREWLAFIRAAGGNAEGARKDYLQAKEELEDLAREQPKNLYISGALARSEAALGNKEGALREAERGMNALPASEDRVLGPIGEENLANVEAQVGEHERAITRIEHLLRTPYGAFPLTVGRLRLDPIWDPLRSHPRFKAIVEAAEPKTIYQ
jgi:tetratricopeptide (TPR) repeat protein